MRYFNTVLFALAMVLAISFGWSISSAITWWGAIDYMMMGSTFGWLFSVGLSLPILLGSRRLPVRTWLKVAMTVWPTAWMALALVLRGEWSIIAMIVVTTAILVLATTPGSPKNNKKTPGAWRQKMKGLFIQPPSNP